MLGTFERPFCVGASCRRISYSPDCAAKCTTKKARRRAERRAWVREYEVDEVDFGGLRRDAGWMFNGPRAKWSWEFWGEEFIVSYAVFGVTPSGLPVPRTP